jgi:hypothetical protein
MSVETRSGKLLLRSRSSTSADAALTERQLEMRRGLRCDHREDGREPQARHPTAEAGQPCPLIAPSSGASRGL